ncbi:MAG: S8 family serine peptidase [Gammaproteobacteria bacterium]|nr:S8 family serine peptidase [Gammaproteobacteria bacterium]
MERLIVSIVCSLRRFMLLGIVLAGASCAAPMDGPEPTDGLVPGAPARPTLTPGHQQLTVSWTAPASPVEVVAYQVRWKPSAQGWANAEVLRTVSGPYTVTITGLTNGTRYDVQVLASSARDDGPWSPSATAAPAACVGEPAPTRTEWSYPASEAEAFTDDERAALERLHAAGWNGNGVQILILDQFNEARPSPEHSTPSHGTGVAHIARHYAPNATFIYAVDGGDSQPAPLDPYTFFVLNRSVSTALPPDLPDRLPIEQSGSTSDLSTEGRIVQLIVLGGGNAEGALAGGAPANATPAIEQSGLVAGYAGYRPDNAGDDFRPIGFMHAKSGLLVVGAVDHRPAHPADGGWTLSHDSDGHSVRAGAARNAFLVAPDDNRASAFAGTSFAAPRVTGAAAVLRQMCPTLTPEQIGYVLLRSARDLGEPGIDDVYGYGLLNLENALDKAKELIAGFDDFDSTIPADS